MTHMNFADKDKLMNDLLTVITDAEELLRMTADHAGETAEGIRERVTQRLNKATAELHCLQNAALSQAKAAGQATDAFVHENPWKSVGIAAGVGLVLGLLASRR